MRKRTRRRRHCAYVRRALEFARASTRKTDVHLIPRVQTYLPGQELQADEVLEMDSSAYDMYHQLNMEWPCLSFDIIRDKLGAKRTGVGY